MPTLPFLYANDLVNTLKRSAEENRFKEMVVYIEACESGSVFDGLLPSNIKVYGTTAGNIQLRAFGFHLDLERRACRSQLCGLSFSSRYIVCEYSAPSMAPERCILSDWTWQPAIHCSKPRVKRPVFATGASIFVLHQRMKRVCGCRFLGRLSR
jgi:hypothetical protein